jgi:peptidoglycan-associated lipoprotein
MRNKQRVVVWIISIFLLTFVVGCKKKVSVAAIAPPSPPPSKAEVAPPPKAPTISEFVAEPSTIERGQSATLRWRVNDASDIEINQGIGAVPSAGDRRVLPNNATTYTLLAKGPGGSATASATVGVTSPPPPPPVPSAPAPPIKTLNERLANEVQDAYFDFDKSNIRDDARAALSNDAGALKTILKDFPKATIVVEGHCDERGSAEYNLGLGDRRATSAKEFLGQLGVTPERLRIISYGKERPQCTESNEACWQKNRRAHFTASESETGTQTNGSQELGGGGR